MPNFEGSNDESGNPTTEDDNDKLTIQLAQHAGERYLDIKLNGTKKLGHRRISIDWVTNGEVEKVLYPWTENGRRVIPFCRTHDVGRVPVIRQFRNGVSVA